MFRLSYRGARYSFGYPACPDVEDQTKVVELLDPSRIGIELSEEFQLHPGAVHLGDHRPPPRGQVLQRHLEPSRASGLRFNLGVR